MSESKKKLVSYHEAGHAILGALAGPFLKLVPLRHFTMFQVDFNTSCTSKYWHWSPTGKEHGVDGHRRQTVVFFFFNGPYPSFVNLGWPFLLHVSHCVQCVPVDLRRFFRKKKSCKNDDVWPKLVTTSFEPSDVLKRWVDMATRQLAADCLNVIPDVPMRPMTAESKLSGSSKADVAGQFHLGISAPDDALVQSTSGFQRGVSAPTTRDALVEDASGFQRGVSAPTTRDALVEDASGFQRGVSAPEARSKGYTPATRHHGLTLDRRLAIIKCTPFFAEFLISIGSPCSVDIFFQSLGEVKSTYKVCLHMWCVWLGLDRLYMFFTNPLSKILLFIYGAFLRYLPHGYGPEKKAKNHSFCSVVSKPGWPGCFAVLWAQAPHILTPGNLGKSAFALPDASTSSTSFGRPRPNSPEDPRQVHLKRHLLLRIVLGGLWGYFLNSQVVLMCFWRLKACCKDL